MGEPVPFFHFGGGMNRLILCFALLFLQPAPVLAETVLDWIAGEWGLENTEAGNCSRYPMRIEVMEKGRFVVATFPRHDEFFPTFSAPVMTAPVLSVEGLTVLIHNDIKIEPYYIALSKDRMSLQTGPVGNLDNRALDPVYTRCP
jgi:hypothetical protein